MEVLEYALCKNRRIDFRDKVSRTAEFICADGTRHQTEVLDASPEGVRLTTHTPVKVGDYIRVNCPFVDEISESSGTVVRWTKPLPGGQRQIVGLQTLRAAYAIKS